MEHMKEAGVGDRGFDFDSVVVEAETFSESVEVENHGSSSSSSETSFGDESQSHISGSEESSKHSATLGWAMQSSVESHLVANEEKTKQDNEGKDKLKPNVSGIDVFLFF